LSELIGRGRDWTDLSAEEKSAISDEVTKTIYDEESLNRKKIADELNEMANQIVKTYDGLIREAHKRL
jgi:hypothetical protein